MVDDSPQDAPSWQLPDAIGGEAALRVLLKDFYDRLFDDLMIGFFFLPHDKQDLIDHQYNYICAHIGRRGHQKYSGRNMRLAHHHLPILGAHFDRRHVILKQTLQDHETPQHVYDAWINLDLSLRSFIVRTGGQARDAMLNQK